MSVELFTAMIVLLLFGQVARPAPSSAEEEGVEAQYARAQLQLAEANLQRIQQINRKLSRSVPANVVAEYERSVEVAKTQVQQAQSGAAENEYQVWLRRAEAAWKTADTTWKSSVAVNQRAPNTFEALDIERFRLRTEVTRLQLERGKQLAGGAREAQLQWQLDVLNYELERQKEENSRIVPFVRYYPYRWR
jgi:hypothetical protein